MPDDDLTRVTIPRRDKTLTADVYAPSPETRFVVCMLALDDPRVDAQLRALGIELIDETTGETVWS